MEGSIQCTGDLSCFASYADNYRIGQTRSPQSPQHLRYVGVRLAHHTIAAYTMSHENEYWSMNQIVADPPKILISVKEFFYHRSDPAGVEFPLSYHQRRIR